MYSLLDFGQDLLSGKAKSDYLGQKVKHGKIFIYWSKRKGYGKIYMG
jgi:hypothetical protein